MKHTPQINFDRATCSCGRMQAVWRRDSEAIGAFTLRAHECYVIHRDLADAPADLFDWRAESGTVEAQSDLFAA